MAADINSPTKEAAVKQEQESSFNSPRRVIKELRGKHYVDLTKESQYSDAWIVLGLITLAAGGLLNSRFLIAGALMLFTISLMGWSWHKLALFGLRYHRRFSETRAFVDETVTLTLSVSNQKFFPLTWLTVVDTVPPNLPLQDQTIALNRLTNQGEFHTFWMPGAFQRLTRQYAIQCAHRGYHTFGPATLTTGDGFGLFDRRVRLNHQDKLIVYPRLYTVQDLNLPAKNPFGELVSRARLFEDPLRTQGIREWQPADRLSRVHWKAAARHQTLLSRLYEPSQDSQILLFLNVATLEKHWQGSIPDLLERTISVTASLAMLAAEQRLPVGLIANGTLPGSDQSLRLLPGSNPQHLTHILEMLAVVTGFAAQPIENHLPQEAPKLPWGATLIVITGITHPPLLETLRTLHQAGRQVVLFTLADQPPALPAEEAGFVIWHLPHLAADLTASTDALIVPREITP